MILINAKGILLSTKEKFLVWVQIVLQILIPFLSSLSTHAASMTDKEAIIALPHSQELGTMATSISSGSEGMKSTATNMATGATAAAVEQWLNQFGTARVELNVDNNGNWDNSSLDLLTPIYDDKKSVLFTQLGIRAPDGRTTGNIGMGVRTFYTDKWMFGGNAFFDNDFTGKNRRIGFGAEAWTNFLKLSANTYAGTTKWHSSRDFNDYNEKPADGYDIRAEAYLPTYPQLGAKLMYEQYYGDKVALFDTDHLQKDPSAVTAGVSYTPVPLIQLGVNYKHGQDSMDETQFLINFQYDFGQNWNYQIDTDKVRLERSLAGSRYNLVERNNQIIMQYKKKDIQSVSNLSLSITADNSPSDGLTPNTAQVLATDKKGQPVRNAIISWSTTGYAKLTTTSSVTDERGVATVDFTDTVAEMINVTAKSGSVSTSQSSRFSTVAVNNVELKIIKDNSVADGLMTNKAQATLTDINGRAIPNSQVTWSAGNPGVLKNTETVTDVNGQVVTEFTSGVPGIIVVSIRAGEKSASAQGNFVSNATTAKIDTMDVTRDGSPANGSATNLVTITVKDNSGTPVANANVALSANTGTVIFGATSARVTGGKTFLTDSQGSLTVGFTDTVAESVTLTATLDNGNAKSVIASFLADSSTAKISNLVVTSGAIANGSDTNQATATVVDNNNNPLPNIDISWSQNGTAILGSATKTDSNGKTTVTFTDIKAETLTIIASFNGSNLSGVSTFIGDNVSAKISELNTTNGALANGIATNQATVTVVDNNNNPLAGIDIIWEQDGTAVFGPSVKTDINGQASVTLSDTKAEIVNVTAKISNGSSLQKTSEFVADSNTMRIKDMMVTSGAIADGTARNQATVIVTDINNNPLANIDVAWSQDGSAVFDSPTKTDSSGKSTVSFSDIKAESINITATVNGTSLSRQSAFVADANTARVDSLVVDRDGSAADGKTENSAIATVLDKNGNPVAGISVQWISDKTTVKFADSGVTGSDGKVRVNYTDTVAETAQITARLSGGSQSKPTIFVPDSASALIRLDVSNSAQSNGEAQVEVRALVTDQNGNIIPNYPLNWSASDNYSTITPVNNVTDAQGKATALVSNSSFINKIVTVTASSGSKSGTVGVIFTGLNSVDVRFVTSTGGTEYTLIAGSGIELEINFPESVNYPTSAMSITLQGDSVVGTSIDNISKYTQDTYHTLIRNVTKVGTIQGTFKIGEFEQTSNILTVVPSSIDSTKSKLVLNPSSIAQGATSVATLTPIDKYGNPYAQIGNGAASIQVAVNGATGVSTPGVFTLMSDGTYQAQIVASSTASTGTFTVTARGGTANMSANLTITPSTTHAKGTIVLYSGLCHVGVSCRTIATVTDSVTGNVLPGVQVSFREVSSTGAIISPSTVTTNGLGTNSTIYITGNEAGNINLVAEIVGSVEPQPVNTIVVNP